MPSRRFGLSCAISTPFAESGAIDIGRLVAHARASMADGCDSITLFGTTGEGFGIGVRERAEVYAAFARGGFDLRTEVGAGIMGASVEEAAAQSAQALEAGCRHLLLAPPFYFKGVSDDGLFGWHQALFAALGAACRDVLLYNLPGQTCVQISPELVTRLRQAAPGVVTGVKDSSGDWAQTERMLATHGDLAILVGDERHLARAVRMGGQGSICGMANIYAGRLLPLVREGRDDAVVNALVEAVIAVPVLPAIKALIADETGDAGWNTVRPPLTPLTEAERTTLFDSIHAILAGARGG
jgi:4-hydroxy-tetrahydrodipicolinate synthase